MSDVTPDELRDTAAMFSAHVEDRGLCRRCLLRWPCDAVVARDALTAAADRIEALEDDNAALRAWPDHPWPDHEPADVSGALADTGDLPGGLRPSAAIRDPVIVAAIEAWLDVAEREPAEGHVWRHDGADHAGPAVIEADPALRDTAT